MTDGPSHQEEEEAKRAFLKKTHLPKLMELFTIIDCASVHICRLHEPLYLSSLSSMDRNDLMKSVDYLTIDLKTPNRCFQLISIRHRYYLS